MNSRSHHKVDIPQFLHTSDRRRSDAFRLPNIRGPNPETSLCLLYARRCGRQSCICTQNNQGTDLDTANRAGTSSAEDYLSVFFCIRSSSNMYALVMQNGPREETGFVPGVYIPKMPSFHAGPRI